VFFTAGDQIDSRQRPRDEVAEGEVNHAAAFAYSLSAAARRALAGEPLPLTIEAVDRHGNLVTNYAAAHASLLDATDRLPADAGSAPRAHVSLAFITAATHGATVGEVGGTITANTTSVNCGLRRRSRVARLGRRPHRGRGDLHDRDREGHVRKHGAVVHRDGELHLDTDSTGDPPRPVYVHHRRHRQTRFPADPPDRRLPERNRSRRASRPFHAGRVRGFSGFRAVCTLTDLQPGAVLGRLIGAK